MADPWGSRDGPSSPALVELEETFPLPICPFLSRPFVFQGVFFHFPLSIYRCKHLGGKKFMKSIKFLKTLFLFAQDSLRERARSERLRRVRGPGVRHSLIPHYPIPHSITVYIPRCPFSTPSLGFLKCFFPFFLIYI